MTSIKSRRDIWKWSRLFWVKGWGLPRRKFDERGIKRVLELEHSIKSMFSPEKYTSANPYNFIKIDPTNVTHIQTLPVDHWLAEHKGRFYKYSPGRVINGNWDRAITPVKDTPLYTGLRERFIKDMPWNETLLHPDRYEVSHPNLSERYCDYTLSEFHQRCDYLDELYESLKRDGYTDPKHEAALDELAINVG